MRWTSTLDHSCSKRNEALTESDNRTQTHSDEFTTVMFAALAEYGRSCQLLLDTETNAHAPNNMDNTAAELSAFLGQHEYVSIISGNIRLHGMDAFLGSDGAEIAAFYPPELAKFIQRLVRTNALHPPKLAIEVSKNATVWWHVKKKLFTLGTLFQKQLHSKEPNGVLSLKLWVVLSTFCTLTKCADYLLKKTMWLKGIAFLFMYHVSMLCSINGGKFEDAKEIVSSFKSVVDVPLSKNFKKAHIFLAQTMSIMKRTVPFGELLATALKIGLEEDQLDALLTLTNGINAKVSDIAIQQKYIESSTVYRDLLLEFEAMVDQKITSLVGQIRTMSKMRMDVPEKVIDVFVGECNNLNSPRSVAEFLAKVVKRCGSPILATEAAIKLFGLIDELNFFVYTMTTEEQNLFCRRFAVIYFWLTNRPSEFSVLQKFMDDRRGVFVYNKLVLLDILIEELGIEEIDTLDTLCLPKAAFLAHGYKRDSIEHFGDLLMENLSALQYVTILCANITFYGKPDKADIYTAEVERILEPVYLFVSNWLDSILENTWPTFENLLIRDTMKDVSKGAIFSDTNETYGSVLEAIQEKMRMVGHPSYRRQYVVTHEHSTGALSRKFDFACRPNACSNTTSMMARTISIRTRTDSNEAFQSLQRLIEFRNSSWPTFFSAMDSQLYSYSFVQTVIKILATKYGIDFNKFVNHSSYVILRQDAYSGWCSSAFALRCDEDLENTFLQTLHYHEDGTIFTNCQDWLVILGF